MGDTATNVDWRSTCPISCALDVLGDRWSLLVVRDLLLHGPRTYSQLLGAPEAISTNILAARLRQLTDLGLITRRDPDGASRGNPYGLTPAGEALRAPLESLAVWSEEHLPTAGG